MKSKLKATLTEALRKWVNDTCEHPDRPQDGWIYDGLHEHMADAAEAVYDACFASSKFTEDQTGA